MSEFGDKVADIVKMNLIGLYNDLDEEGKQTLISATAIIAEQTIALASTEDSVEQEAIKSNIRHAKNALQSLNSIAQIKVYRTVVSILGDILAATVAGLLKL